MDDSKCLLLEFVNENCSIAVGFQEWILIPLSEQKLSHAIEMGIDTLIKWPDCDIEPASKMKKKVESCNWKKCVAIILAAGSWTEMCEKAKTLVDLNVLDSTKSTRKLLKNRNVHSGKKNEQGMKRNKEISKKGKKVNLKKVTNIRKDDFIKKLEVAKSRGTTISDDELSSDSDKSTSSESSDNSVELLRKKFKLIEEENSNSRA
ncbi:uncharacterized protein LOC122499820 [Leptopilina heterotoma]|uniref:uncharacterized protein LOC122499820 n=1 Tax=Leptopilina heterotoma TaxID=63436 RepID=UPI001CA94F05|nr:uncharacterized protein LOC122499820 [Leptopilina heterotoma]